MGRRAPLPWWGDRGPPPHEKWPGVTIAFPAQWAASTSRWESPDGRFYFDVEAAERAVAFFPELLTHHIGEFAGRPFTLLPYQEQLLTRPIFGWKQTADELRRIRKLFAFIAKGGGKSPWAAGTGLYLLFADREPAAEVYALATDKLQARTVHDGAKVFVEQSPALKRRAQILKDAIVYPATRGTYQVLSSESASAHGKRPHCVILDEFHTQTHRDLFEALRKSLAKRRQPLLILISHAGDDDEGICYEEYEYAKRVLDGDAAADTATLPVIFEARPDEDWQDPATWRRVNPGHGITIQHAGVAAEAAEAALEPRKRNDFLRFHLNRWTSSAVAWIPVEWWDDPACQAPPPTLAELQASTAPMAVGIDMAQKVDLAACVIVALWPLEAGAADPLELTIAGAEVPADAAPPVRSLNYRLCLWPMFWLPEDTLRERVAVDRVPYDLWRELGLLRATEGAVIDGEAIRTYLAGLAAGPLPRLKEADIAYDPAFATELALRLAGDGRTVVEVLQNYRHLNEPAQVFEALVKARRVRHGGSRLLRWCLENAAVKRDDAGRIRPVKPRRTAKRIDGVVAALLALGRLLVAPPPPPKPKYQMFVFGGSPDGNR